MSVSPLTASRAALALAAGLGLCFDQWLRGPRLGAAATLYLLLMAGALVLVVALGSLPSARTPGWGYSSCGSPPCRRSGTRHWWSR
jgi:hypothetical protein